MDDLTSPQQQTQQTGPPPSLLALILDTNPHAWSSPSLSALPLSTALQTLLVFINAHLAFSHDNRIALIASHPRRSLFLYPSPASAPPADPPAANANKFLPFAQVETIVKHNFKNLIQSTTEEDISGDEASTTPLAGALSLALSYINRTSLSLASPAAISASSSDQAHAAAQLPLNARVLVLSASGDLAGQYIPLMNAMFGAQATRVPIDILKLAGDSVLLQQASYTSGGIFVSTEVAEPNGTPNGRINGAQAEKTDKIKPNPQGLLQYLFAAFLPDPHARQYLLPPTSPHVDFRAACFCHRRVVDVGYVCSICLSIFCEEIKDIQGLSAWPGEGEGGIKCLTCGSELIYGGAGAAKALAEGESGKKREKKKKDKDKDGKKKDKKKKGIDGVSDVGTPLSGA